MTAWPLWTAVALGGAGGAMARAVIHRSLGGQGQGPPLATLIVNILGTFGLGWALGLTDSGEVLSPWLRTCATAGFCGSLTTFSTFCADVDRIFARPAGRGSPAQPQAPMRPAQVSGVGLIAAHFLLSFAAFWLGRAMVP